MKIATFPALPLRRALSRALSSALVAGLVSGPAFGAASPPVALDAPGGAASYSADLPRLRLKRLMSQAHASNPRDNPVMASPPTISTGTSHDAALTKAVTFVSNGALNGNAGMVAWHGGVPTPGTGGNAPYVFMPVTNIAPSTAGNLSSPTGQATYNAWTNEIDFWTDAPTVELEGIFFTPASGAAFDVLVGDQYAAPDGTLAYPATGLGYIQIAFGSRADRHVRIRFKAVVGFYQISTDPLSSVWKPDQSDVLNVFSFGDSYTECQGLASPINADGCWNSILSDLMGWGGNVYQVGVGSTGYLANATGARTSLAQQIATEIVPVQPDIAMVGDGFNDAPLTIAPVTVSGSAIGGVLTVTSGNVGVVPGMVITCASTILPYGANGTTGVGAAGTYAYSGPDPTGTLSLTLAPQVIAATALTDWRAMRAKFPNALIIVIGPWCGNRNEAAYATTLETLMQAAFQNWGDPNSVWLPENLDTPPHATGTGYIGATNGSGNSDLYVQTDATRWSDAGHAHDARRLAAGLRAIVEAW